MLHVFFGHIGLEERRGGGVIGEVGEMVEVFAGSAGGGCARWRQIEELPRKGGGEKGGGGGGKSWPEMILVLDAISLPLGEGKGKERGRGKCTGDGTFGTGYRAKEKFHRLVGEKNGTAWWKSILEAPCVR